jgi:glycerate dehydrogenase
MSGFFWAGRLTRRADPRGQFLKLVVLDGYTLNPGDLSWSALPLGVECQVFDRTTPDELYERSKDADILLTNKTPLTSPVLQSLPLLKYIGVLATGYNIVDIEQAARQKIVVANVPAYGTNSVAQLVFALILELCNHVGQHSDAVRSGAWSRSPDWCFWQTPLVELHGKTLGIIGYGRIGQSVARLGQAFGMEAVVTNSRSPVPPTGAERWATVDEVFAQSDIVSLHCPLNASTQGMVHAGRIARMKKDAMLINTSRGGLIVEEDLADALNTGRIAGAALDVLSTEPPAESNPLLQAKHCIITPHLAWATREARGRLLATALNNVTAWLSGRPQNVVNGLIK